jgi:8-oxo-dGTP diphosphatase
MAPDTYDEILARNIRAARSRVDIGQESLAARMRALGFSAWIRQTVGSTERGRRRPTAAEIAGLAFALRTTISRLMAPAEEDREVQLQQDGPAVSVNSVRLSAVGKIPVGEVEWNGDKPVIAGADYPEVVRDAMSRMAAGEWPAQPVVAVIVTSSEGVLITARKDRNPPWGFVTGEIEPGELPEDAAVREVKEETGLEVRAGQVIGERDHPVTGKHMIYMAAVPVRGTAVFVGDRAELADVRWVGLAEAGVLLPGMFGPAREHLARELGEAEG